MGQNYTNQALAEKIIADNLLSKEIVDKLLRYANASNLNLDQVLLQRNMISPDKLAPLVTKVKDSYPSQIGDYEIIGEIARGGMGVVYKAQQKGMERIVALKVLIQQSLDDEVQVKRFFREAEAIAQLKHPNIVQLYQMGNHGRMPYFSMQYVEGKTFQDLLKNGEMSLDEKLKILHKVSQAVAFAHKQGIVHRDLKPENILIDTSGEPYLSDFGLAKILGENASLTQTGSVLGTPYYMSPEQIQGKRRKIGAAADIFSLGVILYQILTDQLPFKGDSLVELTNQILNAPIRFTSHKVPTGYQAICQKAMAKKIDQRYSSTSDLVNDLSKVIAGEKIAVEKDLWRLSLLQNLRAHKISILVASIFLAATITFVFLYLSKPQPKEEKLSFAEALKKAQVYQSKKDYSQAQHFSEKALSLQPNSKQALSLLSDALYQAQHWEQMRLAWARLVEHPKVTVNELEAIAQKAIHHNYWQNAEDALAKILDKEDNAQAQKEIFQLYLTQGKIPLARSVLEKIQEPALRNVGKAILAYQENNQSEFLKLKLEASSQDDPLIPFLLGCKLWLQQQSSLTEWEWLGQEAEKNTPEVLAKIKQHYDKAQKAVQKLPEDYFVVWKKQILEDHLFFLNLEAKNAAQNNFSWPKAQEYLNRQIITRQVMFAQTILRFYIRNQLWHQAEKISADFARKYSWESNIHQLRAIILESLGERAQAIRSIQQSVFLNRDGYLASANFSKILLNNLDQEAFRFCTKLIFYQHESNHEFILHDFFLPFLEEVRQEVATTSSVSTVPQNNSFLWRTIFENPNAASVNTAIHLLSKSSSFQEIQKQIQNNTSTLAGLPKRKKQLVDLQEKLQLEEKKREVRIMLLDCYKDSLSRKHSQDQDFQIRRLYQQGELAEKALVQLIHSDSEKPVMRFLAAKALATLTKGSSLKKLFQLEEESYPTSFIVKMAMRSQHIYMNTTINDGLSNEENFYLLLRALYTPVSKNFLEDSFLRHKDDLVVLARVMALRSIGSFKVYDELIPIVARILSNPNPSVRKMAVKILFDIWDEALDECSKEKAIRVSTKHWRAFGKNILDCFQDRSIEVRATIPAMTLKHSIVFRRLLDNKDIQKGKDKVWNTLQQVLQDNLNHSSFDLRVTSAIAIGVTGRASFVVKYLFRSDVDFTARFGMAWGVLKQQKNQLLILRKVIDYILAPTKTAQDKKMKQLLILSLGATNMRGNNSKTINFALGQVLTSVFKKLAGHPDPDLRLAFAGSLLWKGENKDLPILIRMFREEKGRIKKVVACSLAYVLLKEQPKKFKAFLASMRTQPEDYRRLAAWGISERVQQQILYKGIESPNYSTYHHRKYFKSFRDKFTPEMAMLLFHACQMYPAPDIMYELSYAYHLMGENQKSLDYLNKLQKRLNNAKESDLSRFPLHYMRYKCSELLAAIYENKGQEKISIENWLQAYRHFPLRGIARRRLGEYYLPNSYEQNLDKAEHHLWGGFLLSRKEAIISLASVYVQKNEAKELDKFLHRFSNEFSRKTLDYYYAHPVLYKIANHRVIQREASRGKSVTAASAEQFRAITLQDWRISSPIQKPWNEEVTIQDHPTWKRLGNENRDGLQGMIINEINLKEAGVFAKTFVSLPKSQKVLLSLGYQYNIRLWINGKLYQTKEGPYDKYDATLIEKVVPLQSGWNSFIIQVSAKDNKARWNIQIVKSLESGKPITKMRCHPDKILMTNHQNN